MKNTWHEFFQDERGMYSMSRLTFFVALILACAVMLWLCWQEKMTEGYFGIYLGTFAGAAVASKAIDNKTFGNLAPPPIQPGQPPAPPQS